MAQSVRLRKRGRQNRRDEKAVGGIIVKIEKQLSEALMRVAQLEGIYPESKEIGITGKYVNDYLVVFYLAQLIDDGDMEMKIRPSKIPYLMKLLKSEEI